MVPDEVAEDMSPFHGLRVFEFSETVASAYCSRLLATLGADVVTVEPATGGPIRMLGPFSGDAQDTETGAVHLHLNASKKSVALNLNTTAGCEVMERMLRQADVVVQSAVRASEAVVGFELLQEIRPEAVLATVSGLGSQGPYSEYLGTEGVATALGGLTFLSGDPGETPLNPAGNTINCAAGGYAAVALLAALLQREFTGTGQHVEISVAGAVASIIEVSSQRLIIQDNPVQRTGNWQGAARGIFHSRDGHVGSIMRGRERLSDMADWLGVEELKDERFEPFVKMQELDPELEAELNGLLTVGFLGRDKLDTYHAMQAMRMPFGYVADFAEVLSSPQLTDREFFQELEHPRAGKHIIPTGPFTSESMPWRLNRAPYVGEHTEEVLCGLLGYSGSEYAELEAAGVVSSTCPDGQKT